MGITPSVSFSYHLTSSDDDEDASLQPTPGTHPLHPEPPEEHAVHEWEHVVLSECSVSCGRGLRTLVPRCIDKEFPTRSLPDNLCTYQDLTKPLPIVVPCNLQDCPPV